MAYAAPIAEFLRRAPYLHQPHPEGREAGGSTSRATYQVRVYDQSQDRQGARLDDPPSLLARADHVIE